LAEDLPDVDVVVSNAGRPCKLPVLRDQAEQEFRAAMEVNFFGPLGLVRAFAPHLARHRGGICSSNPWLRSSSREARRSTVRARPRP
jgi:NAD(P)-dependent dehydrogenase (short-subunit alcohol dehydrogenase family)